MTDAPLRKGQPLERLPRGERRSARDRSAPPEWLQSIRPTTGVRGALVALFKNTVPASREEFQELIARHLPFQEPPPDLAETATAVFEQLDALRPTA